MECKLYPKKFLTAILMLILPFSLFLEKTYNVVSIGYSDEVICLISFMYIIVLALSKKLFYNDKKFIILVLIIMLLGFISNINSKLISELFPIIVDSISFLKVFFPYIMMKYIARKDKKQLVLKYLLPVAKLLLITSTICGTISLFINIGMSGEKRYGIPSFAFIFQNEGRAGYIFACILLVILLSDLSIRKKKVYTVLALISMIYTTKGVVYIVIACFIVLLIFWYKKKRGTKIGFKYLMVLAVSSILISRFQIESYLSDLNSPRVRLIKYGFLTAKSYFPLGSGFATYGSEMASRYYSRLYIEYGFENFYGLSQQFSDFLNDCYLGLIVGQFGFVGLLLCIWLFALIFIQINKSVNQTSTKALMISIFVGLIVSTLATGIIKSSIGVFVIMTLGLSIGYSEKK